MIRTLLVAILFNSFSVAFAQSHTTVSEWARGSVWYQIFPERFRNGNSSNDPIKQRTVPNLKADWQIHPWASNWYKLQPWEKARGAPFYEMVFERRYGGDLLGVMEKLDYLDRLGVDVLYFNPIFESPSLHKYDASTYHHVDNNFGRDREGDWNALLSETENPATWGFTTADRVFLQLIEKAHDRGIKVVIDGVFNHCGTEFWAFKDVVEKQQKSPYKDWFDIVQWDDPATPDTNEFDYKGWWGYKGMPEFREDENGLVEPVKKYFFNITRRWMDPNVDGDPFDGIDGWRLDVAKDVNPKFWEEWHRYVKSINPEAITVGEIWEEASEWIEKGRFDSVMNYPFAYAVVDFFIDQKERISVSEFDRRLRELREGYPQATNYILLNLVDSHDTDRLASMIKNPDRNYDREAGVRVNPEYDPRKPVAAERNVQKLIAAFQLTYLGAPMIYYGDEAGMWGGDDPDDRKPMVWPDIFYEPETYTTVRPDLSDVDEVRFERDLYRYYRKLIRIRHEHPALQKGDFQTLLIDDDARLYAFRRTHGADEVVVLLNAGAQEQKVELMPGWQKGVVRDVLRDRKVSLANGAVTGVIEGMSAAILVRKQ